MEFYSVLVEMAFISEEFVMKRFEMVESSESIYTIRVPFQTLLFSGMLADCDFGPRFWAAI